MRTTYLFFAYLVWYLGVKAAFTRLFTYDSIFFSIYIYMYIYVTPHVIKLISI